MFTMEDIWTHMPRRKDDPDSVHLALFPIPGTPDEHLVADFAVLHAWRDRVTKQLEPFRALKHKSVDARITLKATPADKVVLEKYGAELADIFIVSDVAITDGRDEVEVAAHAGARCERCWKHFAKLAAEPADVCERCSHALAGVKS